MPTSPDPISPHGLRLPPRILFGRGASLDATAEIAAFGQTILFVHGRDPGRSAALRAALAGEGCQLVSLPCLGEPTLPMLEDALALLRGSGAVAVVAMGGGATLDLGKAIAALLPSPSPPLAHLEIVGDGRPLDVPPLPFVAIPTTAGTGSEATKNAVIAVPEAARKVSLRDDRMVAALAIVDPSLTDGTPVAQTLASGLDAVTQVIEPFLSRRATPLTDALCRPAIADGLGALVALAGGAEHPGARDRLAQTALFSGIALANAGLGAVHGLAGVLGGETGGAHGVICARLLPVVLASLDGALPAEGAARMRLDAVTGMIDAAVPGGTRAMPEWLDACGLAPGPALDTSMRRRVSEAAGASSSMKPSPVRFDKGSLSQILARAFPERRAPS